MSEYVKVMPVADLPPGRCREVQVAGRSVALFNVEGAFYATANSCLHRGGPLGRGDLDGRLVICPWHAWGFDVTTGASETDPEMRLATYDVRVEDGHVLLRME